MDACILVVAATDGAMPQTREHIILAKNIGIEKLLVFINKVDAADAEMIELVEMEMRELLTAQGFNGDETPIVTGSALKALDGVDADIGTNKVLELLKQMDEYIDVPQRSLDKPFSLAIEGAMVITGRGLVVTGVLDQGVIKKGDECEILGFGKKLKSNISGIEMFRQSLERAEAGDTMGCLLKGIKKDDIKRGMALAKPGLFGLQNHLIAEVYLLSQDEGGRKVPVLPESEFVFYNRTFSVTTSVDIPDRKMAMPGENAKLSLKLQYEMPLLKGDRFTLRGGTGTIGYGVIVEFLPNMNYEQFKNDQRKEKKKKQKEKEAAEAAQ